MPPEEPPEPEEPDELDEVFVVAELDAVEPVSEPAEAAPLDAVLDAESGFLLEDEAYRSEYQPPPLRMKPPPREI